MLLTVFTLGPLSLFLSLAGIYVAYTILTVVFDPCCRVPGPVLARFTRLWYLWKVYQGKFERVNIELHKQYGPIVRIAPNTFSLDDIQAAKDIYGHGNAFVKVYYSLPFPFFGHSYMNRHHGTGRGCHQTQKKPLFSQISIPTATVYNEENMPLHIPCRLS